MTDEAALLAAVAANVDDDTPRLVYADWLDDNGEAERAEFVRLQVGLARLTTGDPSLIPLHERQEHLLEAHRTEWLPPGWDPRVGPEHWRRGFVAGVLVSRPVSDWDGAGLAAAPTMDNLSFFHAGMHEDTFRRLPRLPGLRTVRVWNGSGLTARSYAALAAHDGLRTVSVSGSGLDDAGLGHLAGLRRLRSLTAVTTGRGAVVTDEGVARLDGLTELEELTVRSDGVTGRGFGVLPTLPRLRRLDLQQCGLAEEVVVPLGQCPGLEELGLNFDRDQGVGDWLLGALRWLPALRCLDVERADVSAAGFLSLGRLTRLEELTVGGPNFGDEQLAALGGLTGLRRLRIHSPVLTAAGLAALERLPALRAVSLRGEIPAAEAVKALARLPELRYVQLYAADLPDDHLPRLRDLPRLEGLDLVYARLTDRDLAQVGHLPNLRYLGVRQAGLSKEYAWDRRAEWAPRLEAAVLRGTRFGLAWWLDYGLRTF